MKLEPYFEYKTSDGNHHGPKVNGEFLTKTNTIGLVKMWGPKTTNFNIVWGYRLYLYGYDGCWVCFGFWFRKK